MKLFKALLISLSSVLLMNCIGDDTDACIKGCTLHFEYLRFPDHVHKVNVGIFDANGLFVTTRELDKQALSAFQGVDLDLNSGEYIAICWGNAFDNTQIDGFTRGQALPQGNVFHPFVPTAAGQIQTNDSLYYGKHRFTVQQHIQVQDTINFVPAHIHIEIQIKGLPNTTATTPQADHPFIRINNLLPIYDVDMQTLGNPTSYYPSIHVDISTELAHSGCDVLRFGNDNPVTIDVVENTTTNQILYTLNLKEFIQKYGIDIKDGQEVDIPIFFTFNGGDVSVSLIGWEGTPTEPEI